MPDNTTRPTFIALPYRAKDIAGQRFGRLVALGPVERAKSGNMLWLCQCDCGNTAVVAGVLLRSGETKSCGCLQREFVSSLSKTHGMKNTPVYRTWTEVIRRCTDPNRDGYKNYGARGITICNEWRHDFQVFYAYVSNLPNYGEKGYSIDRIDNGGNYEPGNVRWATPSEQMRNVRYNRMITYQGKTQCLQAWEEELGFHNGTLRARLDAGWAVERAMTQNVLRNGRWANEPPVGSTWTPPAGMVGK